VAALTASSKPNGDTNEPEVLSTLRELVAAGEHRLDPMLGAIADAALRLTGASGVALAMWKDGAMVCRARSGETAPPLGAQLSADTGISGECLRTGKTQHCVDTEKNKLVDVEVCRTLGLRSIAVLPIQGWRGVNGILEAFSTEPAAFSPHHLAVLEQLASLAEKARAAKPVGASPTAIVPTAPVVAPVEKPEPAGFLPASDRFVDFVRVLVGRRPLMLGVVGLTTILLIALAIWLGWRGNDGSETKARVADPSSVVLASNASGSNLPMPSAGSPVDALPSNRPAPTGRSVDQRVAGQGVPDNDSVWKPNPGGELLTSSGKPSAARTVKTAAELDAAEAQKNKSARTPSAIGVPGTISAQQPSSVSNSGSTSGSHSAVDSNSSAVSRGDETASLGPPPLAIERSSSALTGVLSSKAMMPSLSAQRISEGISGGQLIRRVPPVYPAQAKSLRMEGKVVLEATVMEDGSVRDLKVVEGSPLFTLSALDAVKQWRYKPFVLNGKPVKSPMRIMVDFKLPGTR
jgi:TonB family protein